MTIINATYLGHPAKCAELLTSAVLLHQRAAQSAKEKRTTTRKRLTRQLKLIRERAKKRGFEEGRLLALAQMSKELAKLKELYQKSVKEAEKECLELTLRLARTVVSHEIASSKESLGIRIAQALQFLIPDTEWRVTVNPAQLNAVKASLENLYPGCTTSLNESSEVALGNAIIETPQGVIELNWSKHLELLERRCHATSER